MISILVGLALVQDPDIKLTADFVFGQSYRVGGPAPVKVVLQNDGATLNGRLVLRWTSFQPDPKKGFELDQLHGQDSLYYELSVVLPEKSRQVHTAYVIGQEEHSGHRLMAALVDDKNRVRAFAEAAGSLVKRNILFVGIVGERMPPQLSRAFDPAAAREVLGLPEGAVPVAFTPLGWPADTPGPKERGPLSDLVRYERW